MKKKPAIVPPVAVGRCWNPAHRTCTVYFANHGKRSTYLHVRELHRMERQ